MARKKNIKKLKPLKKPNARDHSRYKSLHTILPERQNQEVLVLYLLNIIKDLPTKEISELTNKFKDFKVA